MKNHVFKYLSLNASSNPHEIDRLFVSAFFAVNNLNVSNNIFLKNFIINESDGKEFLMLLEFLSIIEKETRKFDVEKLIELFEFVVSPQDRIVNGAVYTPLNIRKYIIQQTISKKKNEAETLTVADIACGCGGFIFNASKELKKLTNKSYYEIFKNQIFGLDIQPYSITRTKILLSILAISEGEDRQEFQFNLFTGDALDFDWKKSYQSFNGFSIILGNPPYVCSRHLSEETKKNLLNWTVCSSGHPDLYIPFFQIGIENLAPEGILGFITMNSFFKSLNGRSLRKYFQEKSLHFKIVDFGTEQVFKSKYTYTCICLVQNKKNEFIKYYKSNNLTEFPPKLATFNIIKYEKLDFKKGWNLQNHDIINKIESTGISLGRRYKTRNGIATLKNDIYIFNPVEEDNDFYYLQNGSIYPIEKTICREILNSNRLANEENINKLKEKVIFPYDNSIKPNLLEEKHLKKHFPHAYKYLEKKKEILDSRDKGEGNYQNWFAFGRTQSLEKMKHKLFFPHFASKTPNYIINSDDELMFYNGLALIGETTNDLIIIKKLMQSRLFWYYIKNSSKPYTSGYFSLSSNYIRNFGICDLDEEEIRFVIKENDQYLLDSFFEDKYDVAIMD